MPNHRRTPRVVCVLMSFSIVGCAGHATPATAARSGDVVKPAPVVSGVIPQTARLLPNKLLMDARLSQTLTTSTPEGFAFSTTVTQKISSADGAVAIPAGTVLRGVVTGVRTATSAKAPVIRLSVDFMELGGRSYGIRSSVFGVALNDSVLTAAGTAKANTAEAHVLSPDSARTLFPIAPAGLREGTVIALAPASSGEPAELPAGSVLMVELDSAIAVQR
jgi:hypothetical protein